MRVFLQRLSLIHIIVCWRYIRRASAVILFDPYTLGSAKTESLQDRLARWLIGRLTTSPVTYIQRATRNRLGYWNNQASDVYVEAVMKLLRGMASYRIMRKIVAHEAVDRIYSISIFPKVSLISQFYQQAEFLLKEQGPIVVIPTDDDYWNMREYFKLAGASIPAAIRFLNAISSHSGRRISGIVLNWAMWPAIIILHIIKYFRFKSSQPKLKVPVIMPLVWGLPDEDGLLHFPEGNKKYEWNNASLFGDKLNHGNVAFYYGEWFFDTYHRRIQEKYMDKRGVRWFDPADFYANREHRLEVINIARNLINHLFKEPAFLVEPYETFRISGHILYNFLKCLLFNYNVEYNVHVEWAEYSPVSIMRTIVANRFGRSTIGVHHSAPGLTGVFPEIRYSFLNRLCLWNEEFRKDYGRHWDIMECLPIGIQRLDYLVKALNPENIKTLHERVRERWKVSGHIIVITLPNYPMRRNYQDPERFPQLYQGILRCLEEIPNLWAVIRPRFPQAWQEYLREPLIKMAYNHPRAICDNEEFSTYEWIAVADVIISGAVSSITLESISAGKKCFTFDSDGLAELIFANYGRDFIFTASEHLVRLIKGALHNDLSLDCKWQQFASDMTYFRDGNNIKRFRDAIWDLADKNKDDSKN